MNAQWSYCFRVATKWMNHLSVLLKFPDKDMSEESGGNEVFELLWYDQISDVVLVSRETLVFEVKLPCRYIIKACLQLRPGEDNTLRLIDFEPFDPQRHLLKFDLGTQFEVHSVSLGIQKQSLLWLILADELKVKHATPINPCSNQPRLFLIEVCEVYQSDLQRNCLYVIQVLIKDVKLEVAWYCEVQLVVWLSYDLGIAYMITWRVDNTRDRMWLSLIKEVDKEDLLFSLWLPNMQTFLVIRHICSKDDNFKTLMNILLCIWIPEYRLNSPSNVFLVLWNEGVSEL